MANYLSVLEKTWVAHVIRPYSTRRPTEIVSAPKIYAFDTGFVSYFKGWHRLRPEDFGHLWEHYVLNEVNSRGLTGRLHYWRDKSGHEVDFVWIKAGEPPIAIECKWSADNADIKNIRIFRKRYPRGANIIVAQDIERSYSRSIAGLEFSFVNLDGLIEKLAAP